MKQTNKWSYWYECPIEYGYSKLKNGSIHFGSWIDVRWINVFNKTPSRSDFNLFNESKIIGDT